MRVKRTIYLNSISALIIDDLENKNSTLNRVRVEDIALLKRTK